MTSFGQIHLLLCFLGLFLPIKYSFALVVVSAIFQGAAVFNIGESGFPPMLMAEVFFVAKVILSHIERDRNVGTGSPVTYLILFCVYTIFTTFVVSPFFEGMTVVLDGGNEKLKLGFRNIFLSLSLLLNVMTVYCSWKYFEKISMEFVTNLFRITILIVVIIGFWEWASKVTGHLGLFPDSFFYCNASYAVLWLQGVRMNSTFLEPSFCGAFLSSALWYLIILPRSRANTILFVITSFAFILNLSGTGLMTFLIMSMCVVLFGKRGRMKILFLILSVGIFALLIGYDDMMQDMVMSKSDSHSGEVRMGSVIRALDVIPETYFLGVGVGQFRCFSFPINLVATTGIIGAYLYYFFCYKLYVPLWKSRIDVYMALAVLGGGLLIAGCLAIPDLSTTMFWMSFNLSAVAYKWNFSSTCTE